MNKRLKKSFFNKSFSTLSYGTTIIIDQTLDHLYNYIEIPLQNTCCYLSHFSSYNTRQRIFFNLLKHCTEILVQSYIITFIFYFILLFFAQIFSFSIQRYYFIDPLLSNNRQCINIKFISINDDNNNNNNNNQFILNNSRLKENFFQENFLIKHEFDEKHIQKNYTQFYYLLDLLQTNHYIICQRSLYIYSRFHIYSKFLHSNQSQYEFFLPKYSSSSFPIDQLPFLDLCVHTDNQSHIELVKSQLLPLSTYYYSSINLFFFNFNFTQVTVTLYQLNHFSTHLERVSIHTGWLFDIYSQFHFFKYHDMLSTVLFDGLTLGQQYVDYFNYTHIPVPADTILGLNEMIQQTILILPLCR